MTLLAQYFSDTAALLQVGFVHNALIAAALLGLISGIISPLIVMRQMSFTVHGTSELALMGASAALLLGVSVSSGAIIGSVLIAIVLAALSLRGRQDAVVGVVLSFGMGLSVLFIHLYPGRTSTAFSLLTGQIIGLTDTSLWTMAIVAVIVVGSLLVIALIITPGAAAAFVTASPVKAIILSTIFAEVAAVGGIVLSLAPGIPVSVLVTTIAFVIYLICYAIGTVQSRKATRDDVQAAKWRK